MTHRANIDFETRSRTDLKKCGAYKYAEGPSTEVLILAISIDGGKVETWDSRQPVKGSKALGLLRKAIEEGYEIHAFNSQFEWAILKYVCPRQFGFPVPVIENMRCTAALCRNAGLPPSLGKCAKFLRVEAQKDGYGLPLINKFSIPQKKTGEFIQWSDEISFTVLGERMTAGQAFQRFVDYCVRDVEAEVEIAKVMEPFALKGKVLETFLADARMNDRGVPVHKVALENAFKLYRQHEAELTESFKKVTGLAPSQNKKLLPWFQAEGYEGTKLDKEARAAFGNSDKLSAKGKRAMRIKAELSFAAVKKIPAMLNMAMSDGFIRGAFKWCGAQKTGRWTSEKVQFTNMKKPGKALRRIIEEVFQAIADGIDLDMLIMLYGDPYEILASLARYFVRFPDRNIYDLDFEQVEAKILPMLIGCQRILERFGTGEDLYTTTAAALTKVLREKFKDFPHIIDRDQGKTIVLATQFQGGWHAVFTATGQTWKRSWCEVAVAVVRKENPEFAAAWSEFQDAFIKAMDNPGSWQPASKYVSFGYTRVAPFPRMLLRLPSKRKVVMPYPEKKPITMVKVETFDPKTDETTKTTWERVAGHHDDWDYLRAKLSIGDPFFNPDTRLKSTFFTWEISYYGHVKDGHYGRVNTYGGDQLQTATQATGYDLLANGILEAEKRGFNPFLCVHDQCLAPEEGCAEDFTDALCTVPKWFEGFPLEAETSVERSYCKN